MRITALAVLAVAHADRLPAQAPGPSPLSCGEVREPSLVATLAKQADAEDEVRAAAHRAGLDSVRGLVYVAPGLGARVIGGNLPQPLADSLSGSLLERLTARRSANPHAALLLRLDPLPLPACGPRRRRESLPRLLNTGELSYVLRDLAIAGRRRALPRRGSGMLRMAITRDAEVASAQLLSADATVQLEEGVLEIARRLRWSAATLDGVPVDVVLMVPVSL